MPDVDGQIGLLDKPDGTQQTIKICVLGEVSADLAA